MADQGERGGVAPDDAALDAQARKVIGALITGRPPERRTRVAPALLNVERRMIPARDGRVASWRVGEGPAVLLVHGFSDSQALWSPLMEKLKAAGRAFVTLDLPGHGQSEDGSSSTDASMEAFAAVAAALGPIDAIVAHSMSAASAICALAEGLPSERAVMISTALPHQREFIEVAARAPAGTPLHVLKRAKEIMVGAQEKAPARQDVGLAAEKLTIPGLLIHCRDDERWMAAGTAYVAARWRGAETFYTNNLGHRPIARDPEIVRKIVDYVR